MDPFSAEGELVNIHNAFHQGQFQEVIDFDTSPFSKENQLPARVLQLRARIQLGQASAVLTETAQSSSSPDIAAVRALAQHTLNPTDSRAQQTASELSQSASENLTVQLLCGTILANTGARDEALTLLSKHQGSLDAVALIVQIHLSQNRLDLAQQEVRRARSWAQDNLLVNLAESWVGLREGGSDKYQSAFYVYEELATAPSTSSVQTLLGQAICELHLGRLPEAEAAMQQALEKTTDTNVLANAAVLFTIAGKDAEAAEALTKLDNAQHQHPLVLDLQRKRDLFDNASAKYSPKFEAVDA